MDTPIEHTAAEPDASEHENGTTTRNVNDTETNPPFSDTLPADLLERPSALIGTLSPKTMTYVLVTSISTPDGLVCMMSARDGEAIILDGVTDREDAVRKAEDVVDNLLGVRYVAALSCILVRGPLWEHHPHTLLTCNIHLSAFDSICNEHWDGSDKGLASMLKCTYNFETRNDDHVARLVDRDHLPTDARQRSLAFLGIASFLEVGSIEAGSRHGQPMTADRSPQWGKTSARTQTNEGDRGLPLGTDASLRMLNSALSVTSLDALTQLQHDHTIGIVDMGACILSGFATAARFLGVTVLGGAELDPERRAAFARIHDVELTADAKNISPEYVDKVQRKALLLGITKIVVCTSFACQPFSPAGSQRGSDDPRYFSPDDAVSIVDRFNASAFICENVTSVPDGWWERTTTLLHYRQFEVDFTVRNASHFGGPTARVRKFLAATAPGFSFSFTLCPRQVQPTRAIQFLERETEPSYSDTPFRVQAPSSAQPGYNGPHVTAVFDNAPPPPPLGKGSLGFTILNPHKPWQTLRAAELGRIYQPASPLGAALSPDAPPGTKPRFITPFVGMLLQGFNPDWREHYPEELHTMAIGESIPTELAVCTIVELFLSLLIIPTQPEPNSDSSLQLHERVIINQQRSTLAGNETSRILSGHFKKCAAMTTDVDLKAEATAWAIRTRSTNSHIASDRLLSPMDASSLARMPFASFCKLIDTEAPPTRPVPTTPHPPDFSPKSYRDIFTVEALEKMQAWFLAEAEDLLRATNTKPGVTPRRLNKTLVLGRKHIKPKAYGPVDAPYKWDLTSEIPVLLAYDAGAQPRPSMALDVNAALELLGDCKDKALVAIIADGVNFQSDHMPYQIVLNPGLLSGLGNVPELAAQLTKLARAGGLRTADSISPIPYCPCIVTGQGLAERKNDAAMRRTADGGGPRKPTCDSDGVQAMAHNDAIAVRQGHDTPLPPTRHANAFDAAGMEAAAFDDDEEQRVAATLKIKFPLERKPKLSHIANDVAILHLPAMLFEMPVISGARDFKGFFNIFALNPLERYKCCYVFLRSALIDAGLESEAKKFSNRFQQDLTIFTEEVLGFGLSASSNIAQRFASAFAEAILDIFAITDTPNIIEAAKTDEQKAWLEERQRLSKTTGRNQLRLASLSIYTDDGFLAAVGHKRFVDFWMLYSKIAFQLNIRFSAIDKQHLSIQIPFIGFHINSLAGSLSIMEHKRAHVLHHLSTLAAGGTMRFDELQSLLGTLGHLREVFTYLTLTPFFSSFSYGNTHGPATIIKVSAEARSLATEWIDELTTVKSVDIVVVAVSNFNASEEAKLRSTDASALPMPLHHLALQSATLKSFAHHQPFVITSFSDACIEGLGEGPGIGIFCHGLSMYVPIPERFVRLGISPLELGGVGLQYFVITAFFPHIAMSIRTDSSASLKALIKGTSSSPAMRAGVVEIRKSGFAPHTRSFEKELSHQLGLGNLMSDALSRALFDLYRTLCRQYGVKDIRLKPPDNVYDLLEVMREAQIAAEADPHAKAISRPRKRVRFSDADPDINMNGNELRYKVNSFSRHTLRFNTDDSLTSEAIAVRESVAAFRANLAPNKRTASPTASHPPKRRVIQPRPTPAAPPRSFGPTSFSTFGTIPGSEAAKVRASMEAWKARRPPTPPSPTAWTLTSTAPSTQHFMQLHNTAVGGLQPAQQTEWAPPSPPGHLSFTGTLAPHAHFLPSLVANAFSAADESAEPATLAKDNRTWTKWTEFCTLVNTPVWRPETSHTDDGYRHECNLVLGFVAWLRQTLRPRSKADRAADKPVRSDTLQSYTSSLRRIYARRNRTFVSPAVMRQVIYGYSKMLVRKYGAAAVTPKRPEPLHCKRLETILALQNGTQLGGKTADFILRWDNLRYTSMAALLCLGLACGFRKAEMVAQHHADVAKGHCLSLLSIVYVIKNVNYVDPTLTLLESMTDGDRIIIKPPLAKNDPIGLYFTTKPIYLSWRPHTLNACKRLIALAVAKLRFTRSAKPPGATLANTALFCNNTPWVPLTASMADGIFKHMKMAAFDKSLWEHLTLHSLRVACATAMLLAGCTTAEIQSAVRWRSADSVEIYAKTSPETFARWSSAAEKMHADTSETAALCTIDLTDADREQLIADAHANLD